MKPSFLMEIDSSKFLTCFQASELQYCEAMMGQLERAGAPAAAAAFASAAVQHVDAALVANNAPPDEVARREGRLWANLFEYALQGGAFEVSSGV